MTGHPFRFGLVSASARGEEDWASQARRAEDLGYSTLQVPDTLDTFAPLPALAAAAAATTRLRVGSYVLATARREPEAVAWEAATLQVLTDGRLELGLGAGRPAARQEAERLGLRFGTAQQRLDRLTATIAAVRQRSPDMAVLVAAQAPRALTLAAQLADVVALGVPPNTDETGLARAVSTVRTAAGDRCPELNLNLAVVGDQLPPWLATRIPGDLAGLDGTSVAVLRGSHAERRDTLQRRRDQLGISYISCSAAFATELAPLVAELAGN